jgi:hypothetical protein
MIFLTQNPITLVRSNKKETKQKRLLFIGFFKQNPINKRRLIYVIDRMENMSVD